MWCVRRAYHGENLEGLHSMLEKELWHRIPSSPAGNSFLRPYACVKACLSDITASQCNRAMRYETRACGLLRWKRYVRRGPRHSRRIECTPWKLTSPQRCTFSAAAVCGEPLAPAQPEEAPGGGPAPECQVPAWVRLSLALSHEHALLLHVIIQLSCCLGPH